MSLLRRGKRTHFVDFLNDTLYHFKKNAKIYLLTAAISSSAFLGWTNRDKISLPDFSKISITQIQPKQEKDFNKILNNHVSRIEDAIFAKNWVLANTLFNEFQVFLTEVFSKQSTDSRRVYYKFRDVQSKMVKCYEQVKSISELINSAGSAITTDDYDHANDSIKKAIKIAFSKELILSERTEDFTFKELSRIIENHLFNQVKDKQITYFTSVLDFIDVLAIDVSTNKAHQHGNFKKSLTKVFNEITTQQTKLVEFNDSNLVRVSEYNILFSQTKSMSDKGIRFYVNSSQQINEINEFAISEIGDHVQYYADKLDINNMTKYIKLLEDHATIEQTRTAVLKSSVPLGKLIIKYPQSFKSIIKIFDLIKNSSLSKEHKSLIFAQCEKNTNVIHANHSKEQKILKKALRKAEGSWF